jgi:hypothetical protein
MIVKRIKKGQPTTIRFTKDQENFLQQVAKQYKQESIASTVRMIIEDFHKHNPIEIS